jgi:PTS system nitrogen regulatory IIA component
VSPKVLDSSSQPLLHLPTIAEALQIGGIYYKIPGTQKQDVLREIVNRIPAIVSPNLDTDAIFSALIARETLGSTGIGNGIAIPHVRNPIVLDVEQPLIVLCFLATPIDFNAIDNKPVDTFFTIISTTVRVHLHLIARLSFLLQSSNVLEKLQSHADANAIVSTMQMIESTLMAREAEITGKA